LGGWLSWVSAERAAQIAYGVFDPDGADRSGGCLELFPGVEGAGEVAASQVDFGQLGEDDCSAALAQARDTEGGAGA
jgi:hypothetical protein